MSYEEFRKKIIKLHEDDNNKHSLQWFLNDIFESAEEYLLFSESQKEMISSALRHDEEQGIFDTEKSKKDYKEIFNKLFDE